MAFGSCLVRRLILSTTDEFEQVTVYDQNDTTIGYLEHNVVLPVHDLFPSGAYYIECKYQSVLRLSSCRPLLHTYPI